MDKLPDKLIDLRLIRINRNMDKLCKCTNSTYTIDTTNRIVNCDYCGARVDSFEVLLDIAKRNEEAHERTSKLLEQRRQIENYKINLVTFRELEGKYRGKKMLPVCPHCNKGFYFEEISIWTSRELEEYRRGVERRREKLGQTERDREK